jgi:hypothetical protein
MSGNSYLLLSRKVTTTFWRKLKSMTLHRFALYVMQEKIMTTFFFLMRGHNAWERCTAREGPSCNRTTTSDLLGSILESKLWAETQEAYLNESQDTDGQCTLSKRQRPYWWRHGKKGMIEYIHESKGKVIDRPVHTTLGYWLLRKYRHSRDRRRKKQTIRCRCTTRETFANKLQNVAMATNSRAHNKSTSPILVETDNINTFSVKVVSFASGHRNTTSLFTIREDNFTPTDIE